MKFCGSDSGKALLKADLPYRARQAVIGDRCTCERISKYVSMTVILNFSPRGTVVDARSGCAPVAVHSHSTAPAVPGWPRSRGTAVSSLPLEALYSEPRAPQSDKQRRQRCGTHTKQEEPAECMGGVRMS